MISVMLSLSGLILFGLTFVSISVHVHGSYYCSSGQSKPGDPRLPVINVTAFVIEYQVNILDGRYTMWAREDYDYVANKARVTMNKDGTEEGIIMDYNDNLIVSYLYNDVAKTSYSCTIEQLNTSKSDNFHLFGAVMSGTRSMPHIYSSSEVFRFDSSLDETYIGNTTIDGVPVEHWQSCMYWADDKDNFTLDYYFTTPDWTPVDLNGPKQIPVRAVISGIKDTGSGVAYVINHIYEYLNFRVYPRLPEENFALPANMKCEDSKGLMTKPLPSMPNRMSYTVEIVNGDTRMIDVFYDEERRLIRTLEANVIAIDDFNTGVHYSINKTTQICSARSITAAADSDAAKSTRFVHLKGRQELFNLDGDFTYTGQVDVRSISCDAWVGTKMEQEVNNSIEVYFSLKSQKYNNLFSGQVLVSLTSSRNSNITVYNFFNQMPNPDITTNLFDITLCRNDSTMIDFRLVFTYTPEDVFQQHQQYSLIHDTLSSLVVKLTGISPVQVNWVDLQVDNVNKQLHWIGSFMAPETDFTHTNVSNSTSSISQFEVFSILDQLINDGQLLATVALAAEGTSGPATLHLIGLEITNVNRDVDVSDQSDVSLSHFIISDQCRVANFTPEESIYAISAQACADLCVQKSIYECISFSYCSQSRQCQLSSKRWENVTMIQTKTCNFYIRDFTSDFMKIPGITVIPVDQEPTLDVPSAQTCANLCITEKNFSCESFDYCETSHVCHLGRNHYFGSSPTDVLNSTECDHYSRSYIVDYNKSSATALSNSSLTSVIVADDSSPTHCSYLCSKDDVDCVRFSFCSSTMQCQLVPSSSFRSVKTQSSSECDVYTLKSYEHAVGPGRNSNGGSTTDSDTTYSPGSMAGLAIGMIIVGIFLCVCIMFVLRRFHIWNVS